MHALGYDVLKPSELQLNDVVCYCKPAVGAFRDMRVVKVDDDGVVLRRPYIDNDGTAKYEELYWLKDSNFFFQLLSRK
jgi:hypothetical protein